jgi:hypothetical protein
MILLQVKLDAAFTSTNYAPWRPRIPSITLTSRTWTVASLARHPRSPGIFSAEYFGIGGSEKADIAWNSTRIQLRSNRAFKHVSRQRSSTSLYPSHWHPTLHGNANPTRPHGISKTNPIGLQLYSNRDAPTLCTHVPCSPCSITHVHGHPLAPRTSRTSWSSTRTHQKHTKTRFSYNDKNHSIATRIGTNTHRSLRTQNHLFPQFSVGLKTSIGNNQATYSSRDFAA